MSIDLRGEEFLNKLYKDLHMSDIVTHIAQSSDKPSEKIRRYMDRLERLHSKANTEHKKEMLKQLYYDRYVIKEESINAFGNREIIDLVINAQKKSLSDWIDYLTDENTKYPMWAKYWVFQGMLKIGTYDEANDTYGRRNNKTDAAFIDCNPELIAKCIEFIMKYVQKEELNDEEVEKLIVSGSFQRLYLLLIKRSKKELVSHSDSNDGIWIKYNYETLEEAKEKEARGEKPEYKKLYDSLQGYNTEWCTAGSIDMARRQICGGGYEGGDFYVYYTKDKNDEYKIPRIAIRMDGHEKIGEIRGVDKSQNLEFGLEDIVLNKINSIPNINLDDKESALKKVECQRRLTLLNNKTKKGIQLTEEEIRFIFELDSSIETFGWLKDDRIKIIKGRVKIDNRDIALQCVNKNGLNLEFLNEELRADKEIVLAVVGKNGWALEYASKELRADKEVVLTAIKRHCGAFNMSVKN